MVKQKRIEVPTKGNGQMIDITGEAAAAVRESGLKDGIITVFVPGATGGVTTIEYEDGLEHDFDALMDRIIPQSMEYRHNLKWHDGNGHSHVRASLLGPSLTVPFTGGSLTLGTWQQIVLLDYDVKSRNRKLIFQMIGE